MIPSAAKAGEIRWLRDLPAAMALCLLVLLVFGQVVTFGTMMMDEYGLLWQNSDIQNGVSLPGVKFALTGFNMGMWMPVTNLTHLIDVSLFGKAPAGHHAHSLLWHMATAALWYFTLVFLTGRPFESFFASALFALHPMRAEAVAWIACRRELTCGFFYALAVLLYGHYAVRPRRTRMLLVVAAMTLAVMSKPMAVTIPCVLLLLDFWPLGRLSWKERGRAPLLVFEKLPLFALSIFSVWIGYVGQRSMPSTVDLSEKLSLAFRIGNAVLSYGRYLWNTVCPLWLSGYYPELRGGLPVYSLLAAIVVLIALTALVLWSQKGHAFTGWAWFGGTLVPVIGLIGFGNAAMANRWTYIPHMGLMMAVSWTWCEIAQMPALRGANAAAAPAGKKNRKKKTFTDHSPAWFRNAGVSAAVLLCVILGMRETSYWCNDEVLSNRMLAVSRGENAAAHTNLGYLRNKQGMAQQALFHYQEAERLEPHNPVHASNLAAMLNHLKRYRDAETLLAPVLEKHAINPHVWMQYGVALLEQGRPSEALPNIERAVEMQPKNYMSHTNLGICLKMLGERDKARACFEKALELEPKYQLARDNLAELSSMQPQGEAAPGWSDYAH